LGPFAVGAIRVIRVIRVIGAVADLPAGAEPSDVDNLVYLYRHPYLFMGMMPPQPVDGKGPTVTIV
jgi:hypothetical protein